ncbi:hypothetical protein [Nevskia sp.]|uniref:hypothetical protein n=1 Tax=Nevskia sp. TaxID=1929292 RepID=UPI0025EE4744|nr:hypothetical protein [Nevskia sp.]
MNRPAEGLFKAGDRAIPKNRMNQAPVTQIDHLFPVGNVELCIKAGTDICDCLEDVNMFTSQVSRTLAELVRERTGSFLEVDQEVIWGMSHMLNLVNGISQAASRGLLAGEVDPALQQGEKS